MSSRNGILKVDVILHDLFDDPLVIDTVEELLSSNMRASTILEVPDHMSGAREDQRAPGALDNLLGWMCLFTCQPSSSLLVYSNNLTADSTHDFTVALSAPKTLEVFAAELAHNVLRQFLLDALFAFDKRRHLFDLVRYESFPVLAIDVAFLAVEVVGLVLLVILHALFRAKQLLAPFIGAFHRVLLESLARLSVEAVDRVFGIGVRHFDVECRMLMSWER